MRPGPCSDRRRIRVLQSENCISGKFISAEHLCWNNSGGNDDAAESLITDLQDDTRSGVATKAAGSAFPRILFRAEERGCEEWLAQMDAGEDEPSAIKRLICVRKICSEFARDCLVLQFTGKISAGLLERNAADLPLRAPGFADEMHRLISTHLPAFIVSGCRPMPSTCTLQSFLTGPRRLFPGVCFASFFTFVTKNLQIR